MTEGLTLLEADTISVAPDPDLPYVALEVSDPAGQGVRIILDDHEILDLTLKLIGLLARRQGGSST